MEDRYLAAATKHESTHPRVLRHFRCFGLGATRSADSVCHATDHPRSGDAAKWQCDATEYDSNYRTLIILPQPFSAKSPKTVWRTSSKDESSSGARQTAERNSTDRCERTMGRPRQPAGYDRPAAAQGNEVSIQMQEEYLKIASKQTHTWLESLRKQESRTSPSMWWEGPWPVKEWVALKAQKAVPGCHCRGNCESDARQVDQRRQKR